MIFLCFIKPKIRRLKMVKEYQGISLPLGLIHRIDNIIENKQLGYNSKSDFIKEAIRLRIESMEDKYEIDSKTKKNKHD